MRLVLCAMLAGAAALVAAACSDNPAQPTTTCVITLGQVTTAVPAAGAAGSVTVSTAAACAWTAASGSSFITISQGLTGTGNGTVQYTIAANTGAARTGTISVGGTTITFTQAAAPVVTVTPTLTTPSLQSPAGGQTVDSLTPTLVVNNAAAAGAVGPVSYRFEVSDVDSFPDSRTQAADGIAQGGGATTSWQVARGLNPNTTYFWRVRASGTALTTAFTGAETFRTPNICAFNLSATTISVSSGASTATVSVSAHSTCAWTATSNAAFLTITSGASGTGDGTVTISIASSAGAGRSGTLTIAGQTVTVNQAGSGVIASFNLLDPSTQAGPATECWFKSVAGLPTTCTLTSTSFTTGPLPIVSYAWTVQYTYVTAKTITGSNAQLAFSDLCGQTTSTPEGASNPLSVTLTVTDSAGNTATATSGTGSQPALAVRLFACGI